MNTLTQAKSKLERIRAEKEDNAQAIRNEHDRIPFGQPNIIGRRDIYKDVKRCYDKNRRLIEQEEQQEQRVELLEMVEEFKEDHALLKNVHVVGRSSYATVGAKTSVNNLDYFKNKLQQLIQENEEAKTFNKTKPARKRKTLGTEITKLRRKIAALEDMQERDQNKVVSQKTQELIDSGAVNQWKKKPIYYFVKGLKKVALEIDENGEFYISNRYSADTESEKKFVEELLAK